MIWDEQVGDFDWNVTTALPQKAISGIFEQEPFYSDLRRFRNREDLSLTHGEFAQQVARIAVPLHDQEPFELLSEEVRQTKRARRLAWIAGSTLAIMILIALWFATTAQFQRNFARSRELAANAIAQLRTDVGKSLEFANQAMHQYRTAQAEEALRKALSASQVRAKIQLPDHRHDQPTWNPTFAQNLRVSILEK